MSRNRRTLLRSLGLFALTAFVVTMPYDMNWAGSSFALDYGVIIGMVVLSVSVLGWIGGLFAQFLARRHARTIESQKVPSSAVAASKPV